MHLRSQFHSMLQHCKVLVDRHTCWHSDGGWYHLHGKNGCKIDSCSYPFAFNFMSAQQAKLALNLRGRSCRFILSYICLRAGGSRGGFVVGYPLSSKETKLPGKQPLHRSPSEATAYTMADVQELMQFSHSLPSGSHILLRDHTQVLLG